MYGDRIHQRVLKDGVNRTGITIHAVNEHYDEGKILFQASLTVEKEWNKEELTRHIHRLEHTYYPKILELLLNSLERIGK
jgi:phosphoribosylglycinamide formyltransferase-1